MIKLRIGKKHACGCHEAKKLCPGHKKHPRDEIYKKRSAHLEGNEKLLREIDEDELSHIQGVLDSMDPDDMAFNQMFGGKTRVIIDFPTTDSTTEHGKFINMFQELGYKVDWEKGVVSGTRKFVDSSPDAFVDRMLSHDGTTKKDKEKKIQMKIGKWLSKVNDIVDKLIKMRDVVAEYADWEPSFTGTEILNALGEDGAKKYYKLNSILDMYVGGYKARKLRNQPFEITSAAKHWQTNAGYIKKNIDDLISGNKFSIIITRHPVDILRMSDFDDITSCHSPPSRKGVVDSYYKCAVAEAHGHGAIAYAVETSALLDAAGATSVEEAEANIQEGEIFYDEQRADTGELKPVSRLRLRQVRYYANATQAIDRMVDTPSTQLAVPESRVYGAPIPGFRNKVVEWAKENQKEQLTNLPKRAGTDKIDLKAFVRFGGSYEDNQIDVLTRNLIGVDSRDTVEFIGKDTTTEKDLDLNLVGNLMERWDVECAGIANEWNVRYQAVEMAYEVLDDGADSAYIQWNAGMEIKWDRDEWVRLPPWDYDLESATAELRDLGFAFVDADNPRISSTKRGPNDPAPIRFVFSINPESVSHVHLYGKSETIEFDNQGIAAFPDELNDVGADLNKIDDLYDTLKAMLTIYFKREGLIAGGAFIQLVIDIENQEISSYEWDLRSDGDYEDSYEATAALSYDFDPEALGMNPEVLLKILESRPLRLLIRRELLKEPRKTVGTEYWLDIANSSAVDVGGNIRYTIQFRVTADSPDEQVELFRELVTEVDDEDEIAAIMNQVIKNVQNARNPAVAQDLSENKKYDAGWAVQTWKLGL